MCVFSQFVLPCACMSVFCAHGHMGARVHASVLSAGFHYYCCLSHFYFTHKTYELLRDYDEFYTFININCLF